MNFSASTLLTPQKLEFVLSQVEAVDSVPGLAIEVGCYLGGTLLAMAARFPSRRVCGFDTFDGLPHTDAIDHCQNPHKKNDFNDIPSNMIDEFALRGIPILKREFPKNVPPLHIAFCHLDVDLYRGTINSLNYLSNNVVPGGRVVIDDYKFQRTPGVLVAVNEILANPDSGFAIAVEREFQISLVKVR